MTILTVGKGSNSIVAGSGNRYNTATKTGVTAGNWVIARGWGANSTSNTTAVPVDSTNGWTMAEAGVGALIGSVGINSAIMFKQSAGGTESCLFDWNATDTYSEVHIEEVSATLGLLLAQHASNTGAGATTGSVSVVTTIANAYVCCVGSALDSGYATAAFSNAASGYTATYTEADASVDVPGNSASKLVSSAGTQSATWTWTTNATWIGRIAVFVEPSAPTVTPFAQQTASVGGTATFTPSYSNSPTSYQWSKNGTPISGATAASYTTPTVAASDNGAVYSVVATNAAGSSSAVGAYLFVRDIKTGRGQLLGGSAWTYRSERRLPGAMAALRKQFFYGNDPGGAYTGWADFWFPAVAGLTAAQLEAGTAADASSSATVQSVAIAETAAGTDASSSATAQTPAQAEAGAASETPSASVSATAATAESASGADSSAAAMATASAAAETGAASDASSASLSGSAAAAESGAASDAPSATTSSAASIAESGAASDTPAATIAAAVALVESASGVDSSSATLVATASTAEAGTASDTSTGLLSGNFAGSVAESGTASDSSAAAASKTSAIAESGSVADSAAETMAAQAAIAEAGTGSDASASSLVSTATASESGTAADAPTSTVVSTASTAESGTAASIAAAAMGATPAISEAASAADASTGAMQSSAAQAESGSASDVSATGAIIPASISESGTAAEASNSASASQASISEAGTASHAQTVAMSASVAASESASAADTPTGSRQASASVSESGSAVDTPIGGVSLYTVLAEIGFALDAVVVLSITQSAPGDRWIVDARSAHWVVNPRPQRFAVDSRSSRWVINKR